MRRKLTDLTEHPENIKIYGEVSGLEELETSLRENGQLEPLSITKNGLVISGNRRLAAMRNLGWSDCEVRLTSVPNQVVALVEHNRYRVKTKKQILREGRALEREMRKSVGRGRSAKKDRPNEKKDQKLRVATETAKKIGISQNEYRELTWLEKNDPDKIAEIDKGVFRSTGDAYRTSRNATRPTKKRGSRSGLGSILTLEQSLFTAVSQHDFPSLTELTKALKSVYPYSLDLTDTPREERETLVKNLEYLKDLDARELLMVQKKDELDHADLDTDDVIRAFQLIPTKDELDAFMRNPKLSLSDFICGVSGECKKAPEVDKKVWSVLRHATTNMLSKSVPGRSMDWFVGFRNQDGFRVLGIGQFRSPPRVMGKRDEYIQWTPDQRSSLREHIVDLGICVPTQPFGYNYLGGKLVALIADQMIASWEKKYPTKMIALTTTSLFGGHKATQYDGMKWWKHIGETTGKMLMVPLHNDWNKWRAWLKRHHPKEFEERSRVSSPLQSELDLLYRLLNIKNVDMTHEHFRGVYIRTFYDNFREFLQDKIGDMELVAKDQDWFDWWLTRSRRRNENTEDGEELFLEEIDGTELNDWLTARGVNVS